MSIILLDCEWKENKGLLTGVQKLLIPLVGGERERIRQDVVKSNLSFRRSAKAPAGNQKGSDFDEAKPFLSEILKVVQRSNHP